MNKNLKFCPTPGYCNKEELKRYIKSFISKIKLRYHSYDNNENQQGEQIVTEPVIKCKSNWNQRKTIILLKHLLKQQKMMSKTFCKRRKIFQEITFP